MRLATRCVFDSPRSEGLGVRWLSADGSCELQYRASDFLAPGPGKLELVYSPADGGAPTKINVYDFKSPGVALAMYNTDEVSVGSPYRTRGPACHSASRDCCG